ncbi:MAG: hypothetical protein ACR2NU_02780 [Aeoliella sp.]
MIGQELANERDTTVDQYSSQPLPRQPTRPATPMALACVSVDGGRMQTRLDKGAPGVHSPHWRETKNALFLRMTGVAFPADPHPELPQCYANKTRMKSLLSGLEEDATPDGKISEPSSKWRPEKIFRTTLSSLADSQAFGAMMAAEADSRGFYRSEKRAFVSDGLPYNWTIQERHFSDFTPILDFVHAVEHAYAAARASTQENNQAWDLFINWATAIWQGQVAQVIAQLQDCQKLLGQPSAGTEDKDPRKIVADTIRYFKNNASRMDYPQYRIDGLPTTSAHMESLVKEISYRVKGSEKFWNDGPNAEAILQVRAATLCDDDRLSDHMKRRPGNPFKSNVRIKTVLALAG